MPHQNVVGFMPELPEVETIVRTLRPALVGRSLDQVRLKRKDIVHGDPTPIAQVITNKTISDVTRHAKRIYLVFEGDVRLLIHLGMSGRVTIEQQDTPVEKHTHFLAR
ncbi:MAG: DNA-formamidopyrimidine glycosylase family protein, partial [Phycisphaerae bacterium]